MKTIKPSMFNKSHYTSIQTASSSPGKRKGTFGTPMGMIRQIILVDL